jgi:hypothetical protein
MVANLKAGSYRVRYFLRIALEGYTIERITLQDGKFSLLSASITFWNFPVARWLKNEVMLYVFRISSAKFMVLPYFQGKEFH